jgi:hypothetical protein
MTVARRHAATLIALAEAFSPVVAAPGGV